MKGPGLGLQAQLKLWDTILKTRVLNLCLYIEFWDHIFFPSQMLHPDLFPPGKRVEDSCGGWDGWMASPTRWTCVWASSGSWWWTGNPGVLQSMELQRVGQEWVTELSLFIREGNGTPLQYSCLENPMDGGAWKAAVLGVAEGRTRLSYFTFTFMHWRRKWQPTPVFLPGESQGWGSLVGCIAPDKIRIWKDICTPMFIAALFTTTKVWKQPKCPSIDECIKKAWYIYTVEYYLVIKSNEIMPCA